MRLFQKPILPTAIFVAASTVLKGNCYRPEKCGHTAYNYECEKELLRNFLKCYVNPRWRCIFCLKSLKSNYLIIRKTTPMDINLFAGTAATVALFMPVLLIVIGRLITNASLLALFTNYLLTAIYNLMSLEVIHVSPFVRHWCAAVSNYLDAPLMLITFLFFCPDKKNKKLVYIALAVMLAYELVIAVLFGATPKCNMYLLGAGTPLVLVCSVYFFVHYGKMTIVQGKGLGKTMMLVANLFSYGCFVVIYCLYYLVRTPAVADVMFMYHILTFISAVFMSIGLHYVLKRTREMKELQLTRKELALFFDN